MESVAESLASLNIFKKPICLISYTDDGKLQLEEEALGEMIKIDMPLVIVAIAGLYRTGKSCLMNCLAGETQGFPLGSIIESKTKGIWAWCRIHPKRSDQVVLLLDTEGLGDIAKVNQSLNEFVEGEADYENEVLMKDKKIAEEDMKIEIENLVKENREAATRQQKLFEEKMAEERNRTKEHYNKMQSENDAYVKRKEQKLLWLIEQWQNENELCKIQLQKIMTDNKTQRKEFREEIKQLDRATLEREEKNIELSQLLLTEERAFNTTLIETMNSNDKTLIDKYQNMLEEYRNNMKHYITSLIDLRHKQAEEKRQAEISMHKDKQEYEVIKRREAENNFPVLPVASKL